MPYNTTAIPPRKEPTGQAQLPLSRIKKIVAQDQDIAICSNNAAFVLTLAAELFIQHLSEESHTQAKVDPKPRRNIQYKDVANAVARQDNLEFLEDVVPKTVPYKKVKAQSRQQTTLPVTSDRRKSAAAGDDSQLSITAAMAGAAAATNGGAAGAANGDSNSASLPLSSPSSSRQAPPPGPALVEEDPSSQLELEMRQAQASPAGNGDVDMTG